MATTTPLKNQGFYTRTGSFTLNDFIKCYVSSALKIARGRPEERDYHARVLESISTQFKVSSRAIEGVHYFLYQELAKSGNGSPLLYSPQGNVEWAREGLDKESDLIAEHLIVEKEEEIRQKIRKGLVEEVNV